MPRKGHTEARVNRVENGYIESFNDLLARHAAGVRF